MKRTISVVAISGAMIVGLATSALAVSYPITYNGSSMTRPTTMNTKYGSINGSGCAATTTAKTTKAQTIYTDLVPDTGEAWCKQVAVRLFFLSGSSSYYTAWTYDGDSAEIASSTYTSASYKMIVGRAE